MIIYTFTIQTKETLARTVVTLETVAYRGGVQPPPPRNSEDIGGVLDCMSKKNRRLDFVF